MQPQEPEVALPFEFELNQGHLPRPFLSRSNAFLPRRLPSSPPSSPDGSQSGGSLSPPSLLPHAPSRGELLQLSSSSIAFGSSKSMFSYKELWDGTDGFSDANYLGKGGFGSVHKGILPDGKEIAVKQLKADSSQGESEFKAEVEIISRVHHKHLVSLVGYCSAGYEMLLAYEFVPNKTLEFHLHGKAQTILDWSARQLIAVGSAKGLEYLHEDCNPKIIHRDIKAANILLDSKFEAKVADFGLAKDSPDSSTHVSTQVKGTFGYLDPEYAYTGRLTDKSDVYSYGVVLLELITGRVAIDKANPHMDVNLVEWARPFFMRALKGKNDLVDPRLKKQFDRKEMTHMVACAAACTRQSAKDRPKMSQVVRVLEGAVPVETLKAGVTRGHSRGYSRDYNSQQHREEGMTKLKKIASVLKGKWKSEQ
ncbi:putative protein kinase RLK-Pelle-PERK-1 family [Medicago truncatula]|uniref:non-specific serine/threonine protein kinase n=1 Tax=Medicago truncatula TaxID=3880 RepID=G7KPW1_MEDTR|nr:proline-rich receptor-like protein kinase PERK1 isoform X2 [Medicago truncatula]AES76893.2 receptor-like kinase [Medicago truncatula]RHN52912.1 putative protein kinase RLK-Pelle-PERK-1 family [Medicago truncatula]